MHSEFAQWLIDRYPKIDYLTIWRSYSTWPPIGSFLNTANPINTLAPTTMECQAYDYRAVLNTKQIIVNTLSRIPGSVALINPFWHTLMFGDFANHTSQNKPENDLDVAIVGPGSQSGILWDSIFSCCEQVKKRNRFGPRDEFKTGLVFFQWPEIPPAVQLLCMRAHRHGEPVPYTPILELHPHTLSCNSAETLTSYEQLYAPFFIHSKDTDLLIVTSDSSSIIRIRQRIAGDHTIELIHKEPNPMIVPRAIRVALAAVLYSIGKSTPVEIDIESIRSVKESLKMITKNQRNSVAEKILTTGAKIIRVRNHIIHNSLNKVRVPYTETASSLIGFYLNYLKIMGFENSY